MRRSRTYAITFLLITVFISGVSCKSKDKQDVLQDEIATDTIDIVSLDSDIAVNLKRHHITPGNLIYTEFSPDSAFIALVLDSTVRFQAGDDLWSDELPAEWYGVRSSKILYLYDPDADTLHRLAQCEEIVNFYEKKTSRPVQAERFEYFAAVKWSPDGSRLLLLKDRLSNGTTDQDVLVFTMGQEHPGFLETFGVWQDLMKTYQGAEGSEVRDISWIENDKVRMVFGVKGVPSAPHREVIFETRTGKPVSSREIPSI
jgi:hypothetical protein